tara:strand:- start:103 stop:264 length:162 start_codon:yes stop_codon:yes gene_type:complete
MQIVEVQDNREKPNSYCPICGIKNIGFSDDSAETKYTSLYRKCLINRGHSVLN